MTKTTNKKIHNKKINDTPSPQFFVEYIYILDIYKLTVYYTNHVKNHGFQKLDSNFFKHPKSLHVKHMDFPLKNHPGVSSSLDVSMIDLSVLMLKKTTGTTGKCLTPTQLRPFARHLVGKMAIRTAHLLITIRTSQTKTHKSLLLFVA